MRTRGKKNHKFRAKDCKSIIEADSGKTFDNIWPLDISCAFRRHNETKKEIHKEIWKKNLWNPWKEVNFKINTVRGCLIAKCVK